MALPRQNADGQQLCAPAAAERRRPTAVRPRQGCAAGRGSPVDFAQRYGYIQNTMIHSRDARRPLLQEEEENQEEKKKEPDFGLFERILKTRNILLSGEINKTLAERVIRQLILLEAESEEQIRVFIDSPGGDADAGYAIFDMMRFVKPPVLTIGMGLVASAGAIILLAAPKERRLGLPNSHYLIHQPLSGMRGVATEIEIHARELDRLRKRINKLIADETGQLLEKVEKDTDRDYWMGAEEAQSYGLIARIVSRREELGS
jgi:ATP-dependent Clp protease protease subunit